LRSARERLGVDLPQAATTLCLGQTHLRALEDGRLSDLPAPAYAFAYIRSYAEALGLDAEEMVSRFRAESQASAPKPDLSFPAPMPIRGLPAGAILLLGVLLLGGLYATWYRLSGEGRLPAERVALIPEHLAPLAEQALPAVVAARPEPKAPPAPPAAIGQTGEPAMVMPSISAVSAAAAPVVLPPPPLTPAIDTLGEQTRVVIRATADAWIQVKDRNGVIVLNRVLRPGESWPVPNRPGMSFTTGNAGGTEVVLDGAVLASLGGAGAVRRDLALDPDLLREGKTQPLAIATTTAPRP
jgi:cytoskeleton protein RodZ